MPKFENLGWKNSKTNVRFEISTFKIRNWQNLINIKKSILFGQKYLHLGIWAENLRNETSRKFQIFLILKFWFVSIIFRIVLARFGCFGSFWLVPDFSKLDKFYGCQSKIGCSFRFKDRLKSFQKVYYTTTMYVKTVGKPWGK